MFVRYVDNDGVVKTKLADIVDLAHGHAEGVKDGIFRGLVAEKLVGINTDGQSVKMGKTSGAVKLMLDEVSIHRNVQCSCRALYRSQS